MMHGKRIANDDLINLVHVIFLQIVVAVDSIAPVIFGCPQSSTYTVAFGATSRVVTWTEPTATDNTGGQPTVIKSHQPGYRFPVGITQVTYTFRDQSQNPAVCSFTVTGK